MIKFFLLVFLSSSSALALSLLEAVDLALQNSNAFKQSKYDLEKAELAVIQSRAAFLPSLDLTAGYSYNYENPRFLEYEWVSGASLALSQNIYDHGVSRLKYESAEGRRKLAQLDFKRVKSETIVQTARLYFEVLKTAFIEDLQDKNILQVEKVYKLISAQYKQGLRTRQDFLRFESQYQRALVSQTSAQLDALRA
ncbi:MAG: TolC family protein, partial [Pseudobdellovibrionaceae bacterium]